MRWRRSVDSDSTSTYSLDGKKMSFGKYKEELEDIGIWVDAKNFLVFQGDVENIAQKSPKDMTQHFELISGSASYKQAYEDAKARLDDAESEFTQSFEQKRYVMKEKNQMKLQKDEAEAYNSTMEDYQATKRNHFLFELFHIQVNIDKKKKDVAQATKVNKSEQESAE